MGRWIRFLSLLLQVVYLAAVPPSALGDQPSRPAYAPNRLVVKSRDSSSALIAEATSSPALFAQRSELRSLDELSRRYKLRRLRRLVGEAAPGAPAITGRREFRNHIRRIAKRQITEEALATLPDLHDVYILEFEDGSADPRELALKYAADPLVEYAAPDYLLEVAVVPNDPTYSQQYAHTRMSSAAGWDLAKGDANTVIAIIDSGVDWNHPDLAANIWLDSDEIAGNGLDDDANGYIDDTRGWDFVDSTGAGFMPGEDIGPPDNDPMDFAGHGTVVAGVAGAVTNNAVGVAGTCWDCCLMPLRVGARIDTTSTVVSQVYVLESWVTTAIYYAANNGADVINLSLTDPNCASSMRDAIDFAETLGAVTVASAGNHGEGIPTCPASYPNVIGVAATDASDTRAVWSLPQPPFGGSESEWGTWVDVAAPGTNINTTAFDNVYASASGTSLSAPFVSGIAALIRSLRPAFTPAQIKTVIKSTTDRVTSDKYIGTGRVNLLRALQMTATPTARISSPPHDYVISGSSVAVAGAADSTSFASYTLAYGQGLYPASLTTITTSTTRVTSGTLGTWNITALTDNTFYTLRLSVRDTAGNTAIAESLVYLQRSAQQGWPQAVNGTFVGGGVAIDDVDRDGKMEIAARVFRGSGPSSNWSNDLYLFRSDGTPVLGWPILDLNRESNAAPALADVTGDGELEVIFQGGLWAGSTSTGTFYVFNRNGTPLSGWPVSVSGPDLWLCDTPSVADIDNNGSMEIIFPCENGSGHFGTPLAVQIFVFRADGTALPGWPKTVSLGYPEGMSPFDSVTPASIVDLDADGKRDIVFSTASYPDAAIHAYRFDGTVVAGRPLMVAGTSILQLVTGDIDNNGDQEIVGSDVGGGVYAFNHNKTAVPGWPIQIGSGVNPPILADLDNDRDLEIIFYSYLDRVHAYHHTGTTVAGWPVNVTQRPGGGLWPTPIAVDLTGDNRPEIIQPTDDELVVYAWQANGTVLSGWPRAVPGGVESSIAVGDVDNDGQLELVVPHGSSLNVWDLAAPATAGKIQWGQYRFDAGRTGAFISSAPVPSPMNLRVLP